MHNYMQAVAERNAQNHGTHAQRHQRHSAFDPIHAGQREDRAVNNR